MDVIELRKRVGMVFQKSNPFPKSIYDNVAYGLRLQGMKARSDLDAAVEVSQQWQQSSSQVWGGSRRRRPVTVCPPPILTPAPLSPPCCLPACAAAGTLRRGLCSRAVL